MCPPINKYNDERETSTTIYQVELLLRHYRLAHLHVRIISILANLCIILYYLRSIHHSACVAIMYGDMGKKQGQRECDQSKTYTCTKPGECISGDRLESRTSGFVAQLEVRLTKKIFRCTAIFLDHYSSLVYVHLQHSTKCNDALDEKKAFEAYFRFKGVKIQH